MKEEILHDIEEYVRKEYGTDPVFGNNAMHYAFCKWYLIKPDEMPIDDIFSIFDNEIYPVIKERLGISEDNTL